MSKDVWRLPSDFYAAHKANCDGTPAATRCHFFSADRNAGVEGCCVHNGWAYRLLGGSTPVGVTQSDSHGVPAVSSDNPAGPNGLPSKRTLRRT
jgi:hypothetical protein